MGFRKKNKSPPVLSHEFVIQNHADMVSCLAMVTAKFAIMFITTEPVNFYQYGPKDAATVLFYLLIAKMNRRLHLSKTKHSKFNESGQLAAFYLFSFMWGCSILTVVRVPQTPLMGTQRGMLGYADFATNPTFLWEGYPHTLMGFQVKFFYICQIAYWLHALPELYFQKVRKEDIPRQLYYICLYGVHVTGAYVLNLHRLGLVLLVPHYLVELLFHASRLFYFSDENKQKGFTLWALLFVIARLLTLTLSAWMMWKFINFQLKKWREHSQNQASKKRTSSPKNKPHKREPARGGATNGVVKSDDRTRLVVHIRGGAAAATTVTSRPQELHYPGCVRVNVTPPPSLGSVGRSLNRKRRWQLERSATRF
ncbi:hypothetical protein CRUP_013067 [Coryphaenoides rupestris]|nr:hypothetical protein CRUP_013067 [Coryphaenoides rupestris]